MPEVPLSSAMHAALTRMQRQVMADPLYRDIARRKKIDTERASSRHYSRSRERSER